MKFMVLFCVFLIASCIIVDAKGRGRGHSRGRSRGRSRGTSRRTGGWKFEWPWNWGKSHSRTSTHGQHSDHQSAHIPDAPRKADDPPLLGSPQMHERGSTHPAHPVSPVLHNNYHHNHLNDGQHLKQSGADRSYVPPAFAESGRGHSPPNAEQLIEEALGPLRIRFDVDGMINEPRRHYHHHSHSSSHSQSHAGGANNSVVNDTTTVDNSIGSSQYTHNPMHSGNYPAILAPYAHGFGLFSIDNDPVTPEAVSSDTFDISSSAETPILDYYIPEDELKNLTEILFTKDANYLKKYVTMNLQKKVTSEDITDHAPQRLLFISPDIYKIPTLQVLKNMFDNYELISSVKETSTQATKEEENLLLDIFLNTDTMLTAMKWLAAKDYFQSDDFEMKEVLHHIWFRKFEGSTSGFERIFLAELYSEDILIGAQNWLYFHHKESSKEIDYMGYTKKRKIAAKKASLLKINIETEGIVKQNVTMLVGTSPELEMALYTVCFYARPNDICPVSLGGNTIYIYTHSARYSGKDVIDTGFMEF